MQLFTACKEGKIDTVKHLISLGVDVNSKIYPTWFITTFTPVETAARYGHLEVVKYLVSKGADVSHDDHYSFRISTTRGHIEIVKYLLSIGVDVTVYDNQGLANASENGHFELVKYLVNKGADISANKSCALRWAAGMGHYNIVKYLLDCGANPDHCTVFGTGPSDYLMDWINEEMKKYTLIVLLNNKSLLYRDLLRMVIEKTIRYKKYYRY